MCTTLWRRERGRKGVRKGGKEGRRKGGKEEIKEEGREGGGRKRQCRGR